MKELNGRMEDQGRGGTMETRQARQTEKINTALGRNERPDRCVTGVPEEEEREGC